MTHTSTAAWTTDWWHWWRNQNSDQRWNNSGARWETTSWCTTWKFRTNAYWRYDSYFRVNGITTTKSNTTTTSKTTTIDGRMTTKRNMMITSRMITTITCIIQNIIREFWAGTSAPTNDGGDVTTTAADACSPESWLSISHHPFSLPLILGPLVRTLTNCLIPKTTCLSVLVGVIVTCLLYCWSICCGSEYAMVLPSLVMLLLVLPSSLSWFSPACLLWKIGLHLSMSNHCQPLESFISLISWPPHPGPADLVTLTQTNHHGPNSVMLVFEMHWSLSLQSQVRSICSRIKALWVEVKFFWLLAKG